MAFEIGECFAFKRKEFAYLRNDIAFAIFFEKRFNFICIVEVNKLFYSCVKWLNDVFFSVSFL